MAARAWKRGSSWPPSSSSFNNDEPFHPEVILHEEEDLVRQPDENGATTTTTAHQHHHQHHHYHQPLDEMEKVGQLQQLLQDDAEFTTFCPHEAGLSCLLALKDGTFVSCSADDTAKRWSKHKDLRFLETVGCYVGHFSWVTAAVEKEENSTFITGSRDATLKVWNTSSCECVTTLQMDDGVCCLLRTKDKSRIVCGLEGGIVETRRVSDLGLISSFKLHSGSVSSVCELEDGSFVSASGNAPDDEALKRWNEEGTVLQTFQGHSEGVYGVIELNSNTFVSSGGNTSLKIWEVSTGECLHTLTLHTSVVGALIKLSDGLFASGSWDRRLRLWNEDGECVETHNTGYEISCMARLADKSIVTGSGDILEIRRM